MNVVKFLQWTGKELAYLQDDRNNLRPVVLDILRGIRDQYMCQGWQDIVQPEEVVDLFLDEVTLIKLPRGWLAYSVTAPWFSSAPLVSEEVVTADAELDDVIGALTAAAKMVGAKRVVLGTRAVPRGRHMALSRLYESKGCKVSTVELTLEVT